MKKTIRLLSVFLCFVMLFTSVQPLFAYAITPDDIEGVSEITEPTTSIRPANTKVWGFNSAYNTDYSDDEVHIKVKVTPCMPRRVVRLQRYNSNTKKYNDVKIYTTPYTKTATLDITIPRQYRDKALSYWRFSVDKSAKAKAYNSEHFKIYNKDIEPLELSSQAACIYCLDTNKVLFDKNMNKRLKPMSCTKIMTLICVIESGKYHGISRVTSSAINVTAGKILPRAGDSYRNKDLCHAMILTSANDAAVMLSIGTAGSSKSFTKRMNKTAKKIGLKNTHFTNSFGIPDKKHYTTAYDLCKMSAYGYTLDEYLEVVGRGYYSFKSIKYKKKYNCKSADKFVKKGIKGHLGGKTGFSEVKGKGASYSGLFEYKGKVYAVTILNAKTKKIRWEDMTKLYDYIRDHAE